jgi:AcrR family transcriptional regulator
VSAPGFEAVSTGSSRRLPRAQRREAILEGAVRAFAAGGFAATSIAAIAEAAGISQLIVYRHFESKEDLYRSVLESVSARLRDALRGEPDRRGFGVGARSVLAAARHDPEGFRLLWRHAARESSFCAYADRLREQVVDGVEAALAERVPRDALRWAAHAVVGYLVEAVLNWLEFGDPKRDPQFVAATNEAMRAGVRAWGRYTGA